jgi:serine/threonine protein kinase
MGCIAFELLNGENPFITEFDRDLKKKLPKDCCSKELFKILSLMVDVDPKNRIEIDDAFLLLNLLYWGPSIENIKKDFKNEISKFKYIMINEKDENILEYLNNLDKLEKVVKKYF